jgi:hypothetical protein
MDSSGSGQGQVARSCENRFLLGVQFVTHSLMELSPSSETANCAATQEFPSILYISKVYYRVHKSLLLIPIPSTSIESLPSHPIPSL